MPALRGTTDCEGIVKLFVRIAAAWLIAAFAVTRILFPRSSS